VLDGAAEGGGERSSSSGSCRRSSGRGVERRAMRRRGSGQCGAAGSRDRRGVRGVLTRLAEDAVRGVLKKGGQEGGPIRGVIACAGVFRRVQACAHYLLTTTDRLAGDRTSVLVYCGRVQETLPVNWVYQCTRVCVY
jgi:hypothetical protein